MGMQQVIGGGIITVKAKDRDEAIAVAEADYHFRILSALDSGTGGQQPVAWQARHANMNGGMWTDASRYTAEQRAIHIRDDGWEYRPLYPAPTEPKAGVVSEPWTRQDLAEGLALLDGVKLQWIKSSVGPEDDANNWRKYLGDADDLLAHLSMCAALPNTAGEVE